MELKQTVEMMCSGDYKERFRAEYLQLKIRMIGLNNMLEQYKEGTLTFTPSCSYDLLKGQFKAMDLYASYLEERAALEGIELDG
ncbi:MAG: crAss001_48 related protein [Clostridium butyricum]